MKASFFLYYYFIILLVYYCDFIILLFCYLIFYHFVILSFFYLVILISNESLNTDKLEKRLNNTLKSNPTESIINTQGKKKFELINTIITDCKNKNKEVILCSIPFKDEVFQHQENREINNDKCMKNLVEIYDVNYFNGYETFSPKSKNILNSYYYKEDRHWNDKGSKEFAHSFSTYLNKIKSP